MRLQPGALRADLFTISVPDISILWGAKGADLYIRGVKGTEMKNISVTPTEVENVSLDSR